MTNEEYQKTVEQIAKEFADQITELSVENKVLREKTESQDRTIAFLKAQLHIVKPNSTKLPTIEDEHKERESSLFRDRLQPGRLAEARPVLTLTEKLEKSVELTKKEPTE